MDTMPITSAIGQALFYLFVTFFLTIIAYAGISRLIQLLKRLDDKIVNKYEAEEVLRQAGAIAYTPLAILGLIEIVFAYAELFNGLPKHITDTFKQADNTISPYAFAYSVLALINYIVIDRNLKVLIGKTNKTALLLVSIPFAFVYIVFRGKET